MYPVLPYRLPLVAIAFVALLLGACGSDERQGPKNPVVIPKDAPDKESWHTTIVLTDSNWTRAVMEIGHARQYTSRMETLLDSGVYVQFYDRDRKLTATLVADSARIDDRTKDMAAFGRVHVYSAENGRIVDTERLFFDNARRRLHSDAYVKIVAPDRTYEGVGFESDESLSDFVIYKFKGRIVGEQ